MRHSTPDPETEGSINDPLVIVQTFDTQTEASILAARLERAGIEPCIPEQDAVFSNVSPFVGVTVRVAASTWFEATIVILVLVAVGAGAFAHLFGLTGPGAAFFWIWLLFTAGCFLSGSYIRQAYRGLGRAWMILTYHPPIHFIPA